MSRRAKRDKFVSALRRSVRNAAAISGADTPGVFPPHALGLQRQEPRAQHREGHVAMPTDPGADLVVSQARFSLGALETLFDGVPPGGDIDQTLEGDFLGGVGQVEAVLGLGTERAGDQQSLLGSDATLEVGSHPRHDRLDHDGPFLSVPDREVRPSRAGLLVSPLGGLPEMGGGRAPGLPAMAVRRRGLQIAYARVGRHFQEVAFAGPIQGRGGTTRGDRIRRLPPPKAWGNSVETLAKRSRAILADVQNRTCRGTWHLRRRAERRHHGRGR